MPKFEKSFYVKIRVDIESDRQITDDLIQEIASEMDYDISYQDGQTKIINHEIKEIE